MRSIIFLLVVISGRQLAVLALAVLRVFLDFFWARLMITPGP